jgi:hypothetical protein
LSSSESTIAFTIVIVEVGDVKVPWQQLEARLITVEGHGTGSPAARRLTCREPPRPTLCHRCPTREKEIERKKRSREEKED